MKKPAEYNLPDIQIIESEDSQIFTWVPDKVYVVLGQRDSIDKAVNDVISKKHNATILKRPSGGHSVVLTPKTVVVAMTHLGKTLKDIKPTFAKSIDIIIRALSKQDVKNLQIKGISDIVIGDKKITGSSMYFAKTKLFFHAVINLSEKPDFIAQFLKHPETEPDYRQKRNHSEFITSLEEQGYIININKLETDLKTVYYNYFKPLRT